MINCASLHHRKLIPGIRLIHFHPASEGQPYSSNLGLCCPWVGEYKLNSNLQHTQARAAFNLSHIRHYWTEAFRRFCVGGTARSRTLTRSQIFRNTIHRDKWDQLDNKRWSKGKGRSTLVCKSCEIEALVLGLIVPKKNCITWHALDGLSNVMFFRSRSRHARVRLNYTWTVKYELIMLTLRYWANRHDGFTNRSDWVLRWRHRRLVSRRWSRRVWQEPMRWSRNVVHAEMMSSPASRFQNVLFLAVSQLQSTID